ncbi:hypothetical protein PRZ48_004975 [Zasmidium cellare]|uniref:Uncharacterized protein n=1 Tax=Zasmidium cellare TaxID=395010 RepID=A0ABR0ESF1_ZASCE|nr:hypothetical protein PRZ48_004975 [Zasmidium cellare]
MLFFAKQWGRVAGCILAAVIFLFTLTSLDILRPYPELLRSSHKDIADAHAQDIPYRPQDEPESIGTSEAKVDNDETTPGHGEPKAEATATRDGTISTTAHHIFLEGTRAPEAAPSPSSEDSNEPSSAPEPTEAAFRKTIVMGKLSDEDTEWVAELGEWQSVVYTVDLDGNETSPTGFKTEMNKAKEATPYLTYLVDHYDTFPDVAVFIHSHRNGWPAAWHNDAKGYDAINMLNQLKMEAVLDRGFVNLRCIGDPGCPAEIQLNRNPPEQSRHAEIAYPYVYGDFFNMTVDQVRQQVPIIATPCCAQFAVSREQVRKRPKAEYERFLQLIKDSKYDDETLGTVMEYMWHILFGRDPVHCENTQQCWSIVYGRPADWSNFG